MSQLFALCSGEYKSFQKSNKGKSQRSYQSNSIQTLKKLELKFQVQLELLVCNQLKLENNNNNTYYYKW